MSKIDEILEKNKSKKEPFNVPEGYFEDFESRLNARIDALEAQKATTAPVTKEETKSTKFWLTVKPLLYVAASIVAIYCATYVIVQPKINQAAMEMAETSTDDTLTPDSTDYEDFYQYFVEDDDCDSDDLYDYLSYNN